MEEQKTLNSQSNLEGKYQTRKHHISWFQMIIQSLSNQKKNNGTIKPDMYTNDTESGAQK